MTRYLLDTNILSQATRPTSLEPIGKWIEARTFGDLFIATFSLAEIERGIRERAAGQKRRALETWFRGPEGPLAMFAGRILSFDTRAASVWARLMSEGSALGRPRSALDMILAATAVANQCTVVTLNERDFRGTVAIINPAAI